MSGRQIVVTFVAALMAVPVLVYVLPVVARLLSW